MWSAPTTPLRSLTTLFLTAVRLTSARCLRPISVDTYFLEKYGVLLCYDGSGTIIAVYGINDITDGSFSLQSAMGAFDAFKGYAECEVIIENCQIAAPDYDITTYGVDGNIYWELFAEETADGCKIVPHVEGTYFPQNVGSVVLKPLK